MLKVETPKKNRFIFFLLFLTVVSILYALLTTPHRKCTELPKTQQKVCSSCFSNFENLYFEANPSIFFSVGKEAVLKKSFHTKEKTRGYSWKQYTYLPTFGKEPLQIPGTTVIVFERGKTPQHIQHFFHFLEHLLGIWNFGGESAREDVLLFLLAGNGIHNCMDWKGTNEVSYHLIRALFPHAKIQTWHDFLQETQGKTLCFQKAITSDRSMELFKKEPYRTKRMLGDYFQSIPRETWNHFASSIWEYFQIDSLPTDQIVITYVQRSVGRWLTPECEAKLLEKLREIPDVRLQIVDFAEIPFREQVEITAKTDILIGVHGNGLSHTLFLPKGAALIELFPEKSLRLEYRIFARGRGLNYFGWVDHTGWIDHSTASTLGCYGNVFVKELSADVEAIVQAVNSILAQRESSTKKEI